MTEPATVPAAEAVAASRGVRFGWAVLALATGGFAIGTTEFVTMGLLPQIARGMDVSIPSAGHVISAYAVGVVVGAPVLAYFGARLPRRGLLIALMAAFVLGNAVSALAVSQGWLLLARFASGIPHGAYFGVASLVAASLAAPGRRGRAVALVMLGLSVANVVGVPVATWLGQNLGWRSAYWLVAVLGLATIALVRAFVPYLPADPAARGRRELAVFADWQVWLTLLAGAIGFGGMFAAYSYIAPTVTDVGGLPESAVPVFLLLFGLGMVAGTWVAGELADWSILRSLLGSSIGLGAVLLLFWAASPYGWWALPVAFLITVTGSVLVVNLQLRLMQVAGDAQTLGAALNHSSLNIANALGAWLGGLVVAAGAGFRATSLVGVALSVVGFGVVLTSALLASRRRSTPAGR
ncbi:MAG TPA: MFS transporter [Marmoricola sp.]|nr:MFS transporter [Marmoricola sp.]